MTNNQYKAIIIDESGESWVQDGLGIQNKKCRNGQVQRTE